MSWTDANRMCPYASAGCATLAPRAIALARPSPTDVHGACKRAKRAWRVPCVRSGPR